MKTKFASFILPLALLITSSCNQTTNQKENNIAKTFEINQGVNISHWLSQSKIRGDERAKYITEIDFEKISELGFDHVRLPIDEEHMWDEQGNKHEDAFMLLHQAIEWSLNNNLKVIVDLHVIRSHHFNADNNTLWTDTLEQQKFWNFWKELSEELIDYPNHMLAYELMNEAVAENPDDWNNLISRGIEIVRKKEPQRTIVVGSNLWQQVYTFPHLSVPEGDTNIILSFHFYEPFLLTHYKAPWTSTGSYKGEVNYPGYSVDTMHLKSIEEPLNGLIKAQNGYFTKETMEEHIMIAKKVADDLNLPLYCGEFGAYPSTPLETRALLYKDLSEIFKKHNIAWAHWNYKNDFPLVNKETLDPIDELIDVLIIE